MSSRVDPSAACWSPGTSRAAELSVVVACHTFVCALSTRRITRLVLNDDVDDATGLDGIVTSGGERLASFDLGVLFGTPPVASAWVMLSVPYGRDTVPIALRTGACLFVRNVAIETPLPDGLFSSRGVTVDGAFVAGGRLGLDESLPYGLVIDVERLWSNAELSAACAALGRIRGQVQRA